MLRPRREEHLAKLAWLIFVLRAVRSWSLATCAWSKLSRGTYEPVLDD